MHARIDGRDIKLLTRTGLDWSHRYRRTIAALRSMRVKTAYLDAELVLSIEWSAGVQQAQGGKKAKTDRFVSCLPNWTADANGGPVAPRSLSTAEAGHRRKVWSVNVQNSVCLRNCAHDGGFRIAILALLAGVAANKLKQFLL